MTRQVGFKLRLKRKIGLKTNFITKRKTELRLYKPDCFVYFKLRYKLFVMIENSRLSARKSPVVFIIVGPHRIGAAYCYTCRTFRGLCFCLSVCVLGTLASPAKTVEPIAMPFGEQTRVSRLYYVLDRGVHWRHLTNKIERSCAAAMRPYVELLLTLVLLFYSSSTHYSVIGLQVFISSMLMDIHIFAKKILI